MMNSSIKFPYTFVLKKFNAHLLNVMCLCSRSGWYFSDGFGYDHVGRGDTETGADSKAGGGVDGCQCRYLQCW